MSASKRCADVSAAKNRMECVQRHTPPRVGSTPARRNEKETIMTEVSDSAAEAWESAPWG